MNTCDIGPCVYIVRSGDSFKIGKSDKLANRLSGLRNGNPNIELVGVIESKESASLERYFHGRYHTSRYAGEWFRLSPDHVQDFRQHVGFIEANGGEIKQVEPPKRRMAVEPFLTVTELCARWRKNKSTVGRWIKSSQLHATRIGGTWRVRVSEVERVERMNYA